MLSRRRVSVPTSVRRAPEVVWSDDWVKRAKPAQRPTTPRALNGATMQYSSSGAPSRGVSELLESYRQSAWLRAVVDKIGWHFAIVPWQLHERPDKSNPDKRMQSRKLQSLRGDYRHKSLSTALRLGELREIDQHPLLDLLNQPNSQMGGVAFRDLSCKFVDFTGECFQLVVKDGLGIPFQLWPIVPTWVTRLPNADNPTYDLSILGTSVTVPQADVIYIRRHEMLNPYARGAGLGSALGDTIDMDRYAHKFLKSTYFNHAKPDMIISLPGATEDVVADFQQKFENQTRGALRAHRTFFADSEIEVKELNNDVGIEQSIPVLNHIRDTFVSVFGVPPEIMGVLENANRATINQAMTIFARETLMPRLELFADEWQRQLVPLFDDKLILTYTNPVPEDDDYRLDVAKAAPWSLSNREWRQLGNWSNPIEQDEYHMIPLGMTAVEDPAQAILAPGQPTLGGHGTAAPAGAVAPIGEGVVADSSAAASASGQPLSQVTLNGAQMAGILAIVQQVVLGTLPRESAIELILVSVPIAREQAEAILGDVGAGFVPDHLPGTDPNDPRALSTRSYTKGASDPEDAAGEILAAFEPDHLSDELDPLWQASVDQWGQQALDDLGIQASFDMQNPRVKSHLKEFAGTRIDGLNSTTQDALQRELVEGFKSGEGYRELAARVKTVMGTNSERAEKIARTEVMRSSNFANEAAYKQSGAVDRKQWVSTVSDGRTRDEHVVLNGDVVGIDEPFQLGDLQADYPGDFGDPAQDINCRCVIAPVVDEPKAIDALSGIWKAYDGKVKSWEDQAAAAVVKAFKKQQKPVLNALYSLLHD